jgi:hypothetical protein
MAYSKWFTFAGLIAFIATSPLLADDEKLFSRSNVFAVETSEQVDHAVWLLGYASNDKVLFQGRRRGQLTEAHSTTTPAKKKLELLSCHFLKDGAMIIVKAQNHGIEKHGWYLTGDYSTKPPSIVLTEKPTKYSRWTIVDGPHRGDPEEGINKYIKNENDQGKEAWLSMEDKDCEGGSGFRKPVLSFEKKTLYYISNPLSGK